MQSFKYSTAKEQLEAAKAALTGKHNVEIIGHSAKLNRSGDPMLIVRFRIVDNTAANGQEVPGFINFNYNDRSLQTIDSFMSALSLDPVKEFAEQEITIPFLTDWGDRLLGEMLSIGIGFTKGTAEFESMALAQNYYPYGNIAAVDKLINLD